LHHGFVACQVFLEFWPNPIAFEPDADDAHEDSFFSRVNSFSSASFVARAAVAAAVMRSRRSPARRRFANSIHPFNSRGV
jgi:hypothetical protein